VVCSSPLDVALVDFETAIKRDEVDAAAWAARRAKDLVPILREAVFLQCVLGRQQGPLAKAADAALDSLFRSPDRFRRAIDHQRDPAEA
jgi:hypothetical protein